ncbi:hypothetical protein HPG69_016603 [Diceros bicornis minor]|uniref:Uncharacterized protein n=1 Tax=Diceros bicornis minor TaxID=77932 RepID=A0A7J7EU90_DICBM|nr:hypothetical protein HPG69_016603 [Diceros bicornis minor]
MPREVFPTDRAAGTKRDLKLAKLPGPRRSRTVHALPAFSCERPLGPPGSSPGCCNTRALHPRNRLDRLSRALHPWGRDPGSPPERSIPGPGGRPPWRQGAASRRRLFAGSRVASFRGIGRQRPYPSVFPFLGLCAPILDECACVRFWTGENILVIYKLIHTGRGAGLFGEERPGGGAAEETQEEAAAARSRARRGERRFQPPEPSSGISLT